MRDEPTNEQRADAAYDALGHYAVRKEGRDDYDTDDVILVDLLTDLMHLLHSGRWTDFDDDLDHYLATARMHYEEEAE